MVRTFVKGPCKACGSTTGYVEARRNKEGEQFCRVCWREQPEGQVDNPFGALLGLIGKPEEEN